jgi:hypothetical protein
MKTYGGVEVQIRGFLTTELVGGEYQLHAMAELLPGKGEQPLCV